MWILGLKGLKKEKKKKTKRVTHPFHKVKLMIAPNPSITESNAAHMCMNMWVFFPKNKNS